MQQWRSLARNLHQNEISIKFHEIAMKLILVNEISTKYLFKMEISQFILLSQKYKLRYVEDTNWRIFDIFRYFPYFHPLSRYELAYF